MIDINEDYTELLQYNKLMNPKNPQPVKAASAKWVRDCLESCGWAEGDNIPSGLGDYLDAVIKACGLTVSPKTAKDVIQIPVVKQTLSSCLKQTKDFSDLDQLAEEETAKIMGIKPDLSNKLLKQIYDITKNSAKKALKEEQQNSENPEEKEEIKQTASIVTPKEAEKIVKSLPEMPKVSLLKTETPSYSFCPCCGIPLNELYTPAPISDEDRSMFLHHVLGGGRFYKTYPLWGGQVLVTLQSMTPEEENLFDTEYNRYCLVNKDNYNQTLVQRTFTRYKMAGLLHKIEYKDHSYPPVILPNVFEDQFTPDSKTTRVQKFLANAYDCIVTSVEMQRAFDAVLDKYLVDMDNLRKHLYNQDFWNGGTLA